MAPGASLLLLEQLFLGQPPESFATVDGLRCFFFSFFFLMLDFLATVWSGDKEA